MSEFLRGLVPRPSELMKGEGIFEGGLSDLRVTLNCRDVAAEGYILRIDTNSLHIFAHDTAGVFYGKQTLQQILQLSRGRLPCLEIHDAPAFPERGYMLDVSRCRVPKMETLFHLVDLLSKFKYNQLQLYTEHTFAYRGHAKIWKDSSPLTAEEIRILDTYCRDRFIELVPNQNSLGHFERWLQHPEYHRYAECPDGFIHPVSGVRKASGSTLFPSKESEKLIQDLYAELLPNFTSRKFNIGCDEPWELGQGRSSQTKGNLDTGDVFFEWLERISAHVRMAGFQPYFWADAALKYSDKLERIPEDGRAILWGYEVGHPFDEQCEHLQSAGIEFLVSPGDNSWNSLTGRWSVARKNITEAAVAAERWGARGLLLTQWGDQGHAQPWPTLFLPLVLGGAVGWNPREPGIEVAPAVDAFILGDTEQGLGKWLEAVGTIDERLNTLRFNRSLIFALLRESPFPRDADRALAEVPGDLLSNELESLLKDFGEICLSGGDFGNVEAECRLMLEYLRCACDRLQSPGSSVPAHIKEAAREVWSTRFRSGGLEESLNGYL
ncbi:MAG: family 20 glycosylhydrolase [Verrucomicrobiota bacterium]